ncbi:MAG: sulfatase-like hydrolase/transferase, partial [Gemmatimonadales bacterium]|nr:sulfatase-like hydrolase/transferase [Gemmatimonadales bacterium]
MVGGPRPGPREEFSHAYAVWVNPTLLAPAPRPRPNILLVLIDALRPDHLGCYGYHRKTSPFLDRLAASAVLFQDATSQA